MSLCEWYANREVLVTGGTSQLGRALLEKLLRSFPDVKVYLLIRSKDTLRNGERVKKMFESPGYERLRQEQPNAINRVFPLEGNLLYANLGLSEKDAKALRNVSVLFHAGGPCNEVFKYCQTLTNLKVLVVASSIFGLNGRIAEFLQDEDIPKKLTATVVRFGMIGPAYQEPMPGFVEILKAPTAFMVGAGFAYGERDHAAEFTPVDLAVNFLIVAAWERASSDRIHSTEVYNAPPIGCTWGELADKGKRASKNFGYPTFGIRGMTSIAGVHWIVVLLLEWLPSVLSDGILRLCGVKPRISQEYHKVRNALQSLESIFSRPRTVERERFYKLQECLTPEERDAFPITGEIDIESYVVCAAASASKNCVNQSHAKIVKIFKYLYLAIAALFVFLFFFGS